MCPEALVADFRKRLEHYQSDHGLSLGSFPRGACEDASILLAHHLGVHGFGSFRLIKGEKDGRTHVWLSAGALIIDITGDQFSEFGQPVYIGCSSAWHQEWNGEDRGKASISIYGSDFEAKYLSAYRSLISS